MNPKVLLDDQALKSGHDLFGTRWYWMKRNYGINQDSGQASN